MALTYDSSPEVNYEGDLRVWYGSVTGFTTQYAAGGLALDLTKIGFMRQVFAVSTSLSPVTGHLLTWDGSKTSPKLLVMYSNSDSADGPLIEIPDSTDITTAVFYLRIAGK